MTRFLLVLASLLGLSVHAALPSSPDLTCPLKSGQRVPPLNLQTVDSKPFDLTAAMGKQKSILIFYRGGWCPFCSIQLGELARIEGTLVDLGFQVIAISPDKPEAMRESVRQYKMKYLLLSDPELTAAQRFGVAFQSQGGDPLPVPSVFVVDSQGNVQFQYANADFKVRLNPEVLVAVARSIGEGRPIAAPMTVRELPEFDDSKKRELLWQNEEIYFLRSDAAAAGSLTGLAYRYSDKQCFFVDHDPGRARPFIARSTECTPAIRAAATFPYTKIADFDAYRDKLVACVKKGDDECLRSLIARTAVLDADKAPLRDSRTALIARLRRERDPFLATVSGLTRPADKRTTFPAGGARSPASLPRGSFELRDGAWLLTAYGGGELEAPSAGPSRPRGRAPRN